LEAPHNRRRQSWAEEIYHAEPVRERSVVSEYSPIVFGGLMLIAAFGFAGHYIGQNASAHTAASIADIPNIPQTTSIAEKGSLLGDLDSFKAIELKVLRDQTVQSEGKSDLVIDSPGFEPAPVVQPEKSKKKLKAIAEIDKGIKIEPAAVNIKSGDAPSKPSKKLVKVGEGLVLEPGGLKSKAPIKNEKRKVIAQRRIQQAEENCLARAIYFEARSESEMGQMAVAKVILNRTRDGNYPKTICGVVYQGSQRRNSCQFSFACDGLPDDVRSATAWANSKRIAQRAISGDLKMGKAMNNATNYHADYVRPKWAKSMRKLVKIGTHIFYAGG
jgi:Cell Wall Hydrolase